MKKNIIKNIEVIKKVLKFTCLYILLIVIFTYFNYDEKFIRYHIIIYGLVFIIFSLYVFRKSK